MLQEEYVSDAVDLLKKLISTPSVSRNEKEAADYVDMIFRLFLSSAVWYLKRLKQINSLIEKAKRKPRSFTSITRRQRIFLSLNPSASC